VSEELGNLVETGELLSAPDTGESRIVRPGDVVVLSAPPSADKDDLERTRQLLLGRLPDVRDVIVLGGLRFEFSYRSDES
jgi:hypothetical protein